MIKKTLKVLFGALGYEIKKRKDYVSISKGIFTMEGGLNRFQKRGVLINTVIDVGASDGRWSENCLKFFPSADYLLIEAQEAHRSGLEQFRKNNKNVNFILAAAGNKKGKIFFDNRELFGGVASEKPNKNTVESSMVSIDEEVSRIKLQPPFLIKLDTHGFEIPILEGAMETLKKAELIIIETYNYNITVNNLRYWEMCSYMETLGFRPIDIVDLMLRVRDNSFWQMDTFFVPVTNNVFKHQTYK